MKTSKMVLMAFVLCALSGKQAFCAGNLWVQDTTKKVVAADTTVRKKVSMQINSTEDLQRLFQMLTRAMANQAVDTSKVKVEVDPANRNNKNVKIRLNSAEAYLFRLNALNSVKLAEEICKTKI